MDKLHDARRKGWWYASNAIWEMPELKEHDIIVYLFLCRCADDSGSSFPGRKRIASACKISVDTTDRAIQRLERFGLLKVERRAGETGNLTNQFSTLLLLKTRRGKRARNVSSKPKKGWLLTAARRRWGVAAHSGYPRRLQRLP